MLVMLLPEQVSANWDEIRSLTEEATPGPTGADFDRMNNILEDALIGKKKFWISYNEDEIFDGLVGTEIYEDRINGIRTMEIFALWAKGAREGSWTKGWDTLARYAVKNECKRIVAYTKDSSLIRRAERLGGDVSFTFIDIPLTVAI